MNFPWRWARKPRWSTEIACTSRQAVFKHGIDTRRITARCMTPTNWFKFFNAKAEISVREMFERRQNCKRTCELCSRHLEFASSSQVLLYTFVVRGMKPGNDFVRWPRGSWLFTQCILGYAWKRPPLASRRSIVFDCLSSVFPTVALFCTSQVCVANIG